MRIDPAIARLRDEDAAPSAVAAALAAWRARRPVAGLLAELDEYGAGAPLGEVAGLARLLREKRRAAAFAARFIATLVAAQRAAPLAPLPLGHATTPAFARIRLAEAGRAGLSLTAFAPRPHHVPASVLFDDSEAHEIVLAGEGQAVCYRRADGGVEEAEIACTPGTCLNRAGTGEARRIVAVRRPLLVLQLTRTASVPAPAEELALPGGTVLKTISGSKRESRQMMALAVLGALGHRSALPELKRLAIDPAAQRDVRWEALRQVIGLDPRAGMALLAALVLHRADQLAAPAARLRRDLWAAYPELATGMTA